MNEDNAPADTDIDASSWLAIESITLASHWQIPSATKNKGEGEEAVSAHTIAKGSKRESKQERASEKESKTEKRVGWRSFCF